MKERKGISMLDLLTLEFIAFKVMGCVEWNWLWVLAPFWIEILILVVLDVVKKEPPYSLK